MDPGVRGVLIARGPVLTSGATLREPLRWKRIGGSPVWGGIQMFQLWRDKHGRYGQWSFD